MTVLTPKPFEPDAILDLLKQASLLAQQQTRWARIGHLMERLLSMSRSVSVHMDSDGMCCTIDTCDVRQKHLSIQGTDFESALTGLLDQEAVCRVCCKAKSIDQFVARDRLPRRHERLCKACHNEAVRASRQKMEALK